MSNLDILRNKPKFDIEFDNQNSYKLKVAKYFKLDTDQIFSLPEDWAKSTLRSKIKDIFEPEFVTPFLQYIITEYNSKEGEELDYFSLRDYLEAVVNLSYITADEDILDDKEGDEIIAVEFDNSRENLEHLMESYVFWTLLSLAPEEISIEYFKNFDKFSDKKLFDLIFDQFGPDDDIYDFLFIQVVEMRKWAKLPKIDRYEFINNLQTWYTNYHKRYQILVSDVEKIGETQTRFKKLKSNIYATEGCINRAKYKLKIKWKFAGINKKGQYSPQERFLDIFDNIRSSQRIPIILININNFRKYKVHTSNKLLKKIRGKSENVNLDVEKTTGLNKIYFNLYSGLPEGKYTGYSMSMGVIDLLTNELSITLGIDESKWAPLNELLKEIEDVLHLNFVDIDTDDLDNLINYASDISYSFSIPGMEINQFLFVNLVSLDDLFDAYFRFNEINQFYALRSRNEFIFLSQEQDDLVFSMVNSQIDRAGTIDVYKYNKQKKRLKLKLGLNNLKINVLHAPNQKEVDRFKKIFLILLKYYQSQTGLLTDYYTDLKFEVDELSGTKRARIKKVKNVKLDIWRRLYPDMIIPSFSRFGCETKRLPSIVNPDKVVKVDDLKPGTPLYQVEVDLVDPDGNVIMKDGKIVKEKRFAAPWPDKEDPQHFVVCDFNTKYVYVGGKAGNDKFGDTEYKKRFPLIPCCYGNISNYYRLMKTKGSKKGLLKKAGQAKVTLKILNKDSFGIPPISVLNALNEIKNQDWIRLPVPPSDNSFLAAVNLALKKKISKDSLIKQRLDIIKKVDLSCAMQELVGLSITETNDYLTKGFYDSRYVYRMVEEYFNINLVIFNDNRRVDQKSNQTIIGDLEIPNNQQFHVRNYRERPVVILIRFKITEDRDHYQIIGTRDKTNFDLSEEFFDLFNQIYRIETITLRPGNKVRPHNVYKIKEIEKVNPYIYVNGYNNFNWSQYLIQNKFILVNQILDSLGKCRGFLVEFKKNRFFIFTPFCQPINLPAIDYNVNANPHHIEYSKCVEIFGSPSSIDWQQIGYSSQVFGFWYPVSKKWREAIYIPIQLTNAKKIEDDLGMGLRKNKGSNSPINIYDIGGQYKNMERVDKLKLIFYIVLQLLLWCFESYEGSVESFFKLFVREVRTNDDIRFYNIINLKEVKYLPKKLDLMEKVNYSQKVIRRLIREKKFNLPIGTTKYFLYQVKKYLKQNPNYKISYLANSYAFGFVFEKYNDTMILDDRSLYPWFGINDREKLVFKDKIFMEDFEEFKTLLFDYQGVKYIIQKVEGNNYLNALETAFWWYVTRVNRGDMKKLRFKSLMDSPHVSYVINSIGGLELVDNSSGGLVPYLELLLFDPISDYYAAMLPLNYK